MIPDPLVSVLIPAYNASEFIGQALLSIVSQTYRNLEILVCDDASTDDTLACIRAIDDKRIRLLKNDSNQGYLRTVNRLASEARGEFMCFQDADDYSHPDRIATQLDAFRSHPDLGLVGTNYAVINPKGKVVFKRAAETRPEVLKKMLETHNPFQKPSIMFSRAVYEKVGMYRESFLQLGNISEDFDWILRASEHFETANVNHGEPLYYYRSVPTAMSKKVRTPSQLLGHDVALYLWRQRASGKADSLERDEISALRDLIASWEEPFLKDRSLFHHRVAASLMYFGLPWSAVRESLIAISKGPLTWRNYRLLQYCLRKTLIGL